MDTPTSAPTEVAPDETAPALADPPAYIRPKAAALVEGWGQLVARLSSLLRAPPADGALVPALAALDDASLAWIRNDADRVLFVATFSADGEPERYAAAHALLVAACCDLATQVLPDWRDDERRRLRQVALTMNIAMAEQQDLMARQAGPLTAPQRELVSAHPALGAARLRELGVVDADWLAAVEQHHAAPPGPLAGRDAAGRIARLVRRADVHTAALSRRGPRDPLTPSSAARNAYLDEDDQPDECGAALIKVLGIYPPGTLVRLASGEVAVVRCRGPRADHPLALAVLRQDGMPHTTPRLRNCALAEHKVVGSLTRSGIKLRLTLERLLAVDP